MTVATSIPLKAPVEKFAVAGARPKRPNGHEGLAEALDMMGAVVPYPRNAEIFGEDEPSEYFYKVVSGAVRTYKLLDDGRRQIGGFHLPNDIFGLEADSAYRFTAEAISDSTILVARRSALISLAARHVDLAQELWALTARELAHVQNLMLALGRKTAQERVASFLLEMAGRSANFDVFELPMSRQDIADYLGLTIETVSRTLTQLENAAAISLPSSRRIILRNPAALSRLNA
jgi:CRP-like cAMP-binding protein